MKNIKSLSNKYIKELDQLSKSAKRRETSFFIIDGQREIEEAIAAGVIIDEIFICHDLIKKNQN